jgi:hypothetical protein
MEGWVSFSKNVVINNGAILSEFSTDETPGLAELCQIPMHG